MLISYKGRKSGRQVTLPVNYVRDRETLLTLSVRTRTWWWNFSSPAPVTLRLQGRDLSAQGEVVEDEQALLAGLAVFFKGMPQAARYLKIWFDEQGEPAPDDLRQAAEGRVLLRFTQQ